MCVYMKWALILSTLCLLQACDSLNTRKVDAQIFDKVPSSWYASGRLSALFNGERQNAGFKVDFTQQNYQFTLTGALGLGQLVIVSNAQGLNVNNVTVSLTIEQWMRQELGWHFPVYELGEIVFNQGFTNSNWQFKILSRHPNHLPKIVRITHRIQNITIKISLKDVGVNH